MRFHERTLNIKWKKGTKRADKSNAIDMLCSGQILRNEVEKQDYERNFDKVPPPFTIQEREAWLSKLTDVAVSSDAFVSTFFHLMPSPYCKQMPDMVLGATVPIHRQCLPRCTLRCKIHRCSQW
jgi:hypothetical protein